MLSLLSLALAYVSTSQWILYLRSTLSAGGPEIMVPLYTGPSVEGTRCSPRPVGNVALGGAGSSVLRSGSAVGTCGRFARQRNAPSVEQGPWAFSWRSARNSLASMKWQFSGGLWGVGVRVQLHPIREVRQGRVEARSAGCGEPSLTRKVSKVTGGRHRLRGWQTPWHVDRYVREGVATRVP
jgi:hypothetical protein